MFDNETQEYVDLDDLCNNADWYVEQDGGMFAPELYIIPHDLDADSVAPDDKVLDALHQDLREGGRIRQETLDKYGLESVPVHLRRFSAQDGYYYA